MTKDDPRPAKRILVVEDEFWIAEDIAYEIRMLGLDVIGPVESVETALRVIAENGEIDGALLDINVGGELAYPIADALLARGVPLAFTTGYDDANVPDRYSAVARYSKPVTRSVLQQAIARQIDS